VKPGRVELFFWMILRTCSFFFFPCCTSARLPFDSPFFLWADCALFSNAGAVPFPLFFFLPPESSPSCHIHGNSFSYFLLSCCFLFSLQTVSGPFGPRHIRRIRVIPRKRRGVSALPSFANQKRPSPFSRSCRKCSTLQVRNSPSPCASSTRDLSFSPFSFISRSVPGSPPNSQPRNQNCFFFPLPRSPIPFFPA